MTKWQNPFLTVEPRYRTTFELPEVVNSRLKGIDPKEGVVQITVSLLIQKLINELDRIKLTGYSPDEYHFAVANATLTLAEPGGTAEKPTAGLQHPIAVQATERNDGRGVSSVAPETERPSKLSNAASTPKKRREGGKK
jgi:hypothetical protein